jgi:hypothetical protein
MKLTSAQKEARLRQAADEMIAALTAWDEENSAPTLTQIEDKILELRQRLGEEMLAVTIAGQGMRQPVESPPCAECGAEMRNKGTKGRVVESRVGGLELMRGHYYCVHCKSGLFPPRPTT